MKIAVLSQTFIDGKNKARGKGLSEAIDLSNYFHIHLLASTHIQKSFCFQVNKSCKVTSIPYTVYKSLPKSIYEVIRRTTVFITYLLGIIKSERINLIRADNASLWGFSAFIAKLHYGTPYILWLGAMERESIIYKYGNNFLVKIVLTFLNIVERVVISNASLVLCVSQETVKRAIERRAKRVILTPNYVDSKFFEMIPKRRSARSDIVNFVYAGRLEPEKGIDILLAAVSKLQRRKDLHITIAGMGTMQSIVEDACNRIHNLDYVGLLSRDEIRRLFWSSDVLVIPSRTEGLPSAIMESMSTGMPILATDVGEIPNVITDQKEGKLVERDSIDSLINGFLYFLDNKNRISQMRKNCRKLAINLARKYLKMQLKLYTQIGTK